MQAQKSWLFFSRSHTHTLAMGILASFYPLSVKPGAFIHALQHLTEDSNGVLWVAGNPMPLPQLRDASTSSNRDTSLWNLRAHQRHNLHFQDLVASEEQGYCQPCCSPTCFTAAVSMFTWIFRYFLRCVCPLHLFSFTPSLFTCCISFFSLCSLFVHPLGPQPPHHSPLALPVEKVPEGQQHNRHQNSLLLLFLLSLIMQPLTRDVKQSSASCEHIHHCQAKCSLDDWQDRCRCRIHL